MVKRKSKTADEQRHLSAVAALGCMVCKRLGYQDTPCQIHHIRSGQGWGRSSHYQTIGLCEPHHTGNLGVHGLGTKGFPKHYGFTEQDLLDDVNKELNESNSDSNN
jgi:hypothetical protein